ISELILSFRSSSPSPSVIFPLRSSIVTPSTTRSSICISPLLAFQPNRMCAGRRPEPAHWPCATAHAAQLVSGPHRLYEKRPCSVLRNQKECQESAGIYEGCAPGSVCVSVFDRTDCTTTYR